MGDLDVKRDLQCPAGVLARIAGAAALIHLLEATVGGGAARESELCTVHSEVALDVGIVVGVHDADGRRRTSGRSQAVPSPELHRAITGWRPSGVGAPAFVSDHMGMAAGGAESSRSGANRFRAGSHRRSAQQEGSGNHAQEHMLLRNK